MSDMQQLRKHLADTMVGLKAGTTTVATATAMSGVAQVMLNSVKVEIEARKAAGNKQLPDYIREVPVQLTSEERATAEMELASLIPAPDYPALSVITHRMKDTAE